LTVLELCAAGLILIAVRAELPSLGGGFIPCHS
jgi:hypothetical protein